MTADAQIGIPGPELELTGIDVEQRRPSEPAAQARGDAVGQVEQEAIARAGPEILGGCGAVVLLSSGRLVVLIVGEEHDGDPLGDAERLHVVLERLQVSARARDIGLRPQQLEPVRLDSQRPQTEQILERHPENTPARRVLGDEAGTDEDRNHVSSQSAIRRSSTLSDAKALSATARAASHWRR